MKIVVKVGVKPKDQLLPFCIAVSRFQQGSTQDTQTCVLALHDTSRNCSMYVAATPAFVQAGLQDSEVASGGVPFRRSDSNAPRLSITDYEHPKACNNNPLGVPEAPDPKTALASEQQSSSAKDESNSERPSVVSMLAGIAASPYAIPEASMCMLQLNPVLQWPSMQLPPLASPSDSLLQPWLQSARDMLHAYAPDMAENTPPANVALALLSQASSTALQTSQGPGPGPAKDLFLLLTLRALGSANKAAAFCSALMQLPGTPYVWPAFGAAMCGRRPMLGSIHAVRCMLFSEDPEAFAWLDGTDCIDAFAEACLSSSMLWVVSREVCDKLFALSMISGPFVLIAAVVAVLQLLRGRVKDRLAHGDVKEWLMHASVFATPPEVILPQVATLVSKHQDSVLPLMLCGASDR
jgi:hypothetical protein